MKTFLLLVFVSLASLFIARYWWIAWMYHGFLAPPDFLRPIWHASGEGVYDRISIEMILIVEFVTISLVLYFRWR